MAKRIASSSVNWAAIQDRVGDSFKAGFIAFKGQTDKYLRQVTSQEAELPRIDWSYYKSKIVAPGLVDSIQKSYESFTIPYPSDQGLLAEFDKHEATSMKSAAADEAKTIKEIEKFKASLKVLESAIPFSEMTMEEYITANPSLRIDPDNPKLWPVNDPDPDDPDESSHPKDDH